MRVSLPNSCKPTGLDFEPEPCVWFIVSSQDLSGITDLYSLRSDKVYRCPSGYSDISAHIELCINSYGRIDNFVLHEPLGPIPEMDSQQQFSDCSENLFSQWEKHVIPIYEAVRHMLEALKSQQQQRNAKLCRLFLVSHCFGFLGNPKSPVTASCQWAIEGLFESLRFELHESLVQCAILTIGDSLGSTTTVRSKFNELLFELGHCDNVPFRVPADENASQLIRYRLRSTAEEIEDWRFLFEKTI